MLRLKYPSRYVPGYARELDGEVFPYHSPVPGVDTSDGWGAGSLPPQPPQATSDPTSTNAFGVCFDMFCPNESTGDPSQGRPRESYGT
jgi:hypothetical protein